MCIFFGKPNVKESQMRQCVRFNCSSRYGILMIQRDHQSYKG